MPVVTLDEIVGMLREGRTPKQVAAFLGITERAIRNRFDIVTVCLMIFSKVVYRPTV